MRRVLFAVLPVLAIACQKPTHIEIEPKQPVLRNRLDSVQLIAHVMSKSVEFPKERVDWSSKDESIAVVDEIGKASCRKGGRTYLEAKRGDVSAQVPIECAFVESLRTDQPTIELSYESGDPAKPKIEAVSYDGRTLKDRRPFFKPQDEKVCRVDATGQLWPVNKGQTTVVAELDDQKLEITCIVK